VYTTKLMNLGALPNSSFLISASKILRWVSLAGLISRIGGVHMSEQRFPESEIDADRAVGVGGKDTALGSE